ncbi:hypothetical protein JCM6882_001360 [Rhodosporidiobolus microsporus]
MSGLIDEANLDLASTPGLPPPVSSAAPPPPPPPSVIPTAQRARIVNGVHTDVLVQSFADRILVVVTQLGRIGCMIQVSPPPPTLPSPVPPPPSSNSLLASLPPPHPSTVLSPLFGVPPSPHISSLHDLYASQIGAIVFSRSGGGGGPGGGLEDLGGMPVLAGAAKPVVLGIALKIKPPAEGEEGDGEGGVTEEERQTFGEVMEMILECLG